LAGSGGAIAGRFSTGAGCRSSFEKKTGAAEAAPFLPRLTSTEKGFKVRRTTDSMEFERKGKNQSVNLALKFFLLDERRMISSRNGSTPSTFTKHENVNRDLTKASALHKIV
jgi:hypothetical protein